MIKWYCMKKSCFIIATLLFIREHGVKASVIGDETNVYIIGNETLKLDADTSRYLSVFVETGKSKNTIILINLLISMHANRQDFREQ